MIPRSCVTAPEQTLHRQGSRGGTDESRVAPITTTHGREQRGEQETDGRWQTAARHAAAAYGVVTRRGSATGIGTRSSVTAGAGIDRAVRPAVITRTRALA